jgi:hypothetical protein
MCRAIRSSEDARTTGTSAASAIADDEIAPSARAVPARAVLGVGTHPATSNNSIPSNA